MSGSMNEIVTLLNIHIFSLYNFYTWLTVTVLFCLFVNALYEWKLEHHQDKFLCTVYLSLVNKYLSKLYPCIITELIIIALMLYKTPQGEACVRCPDLKTIFQRNGREEEATTACSTTNLSAPDYRNNPHPRPCQRLE